MNIIEVTAVAEDGEEYTLIACSVPKTMTTFGGTTKSGFDGTIETADGRPVARLAKGEYELTDEPGRILRSDDPDAP